MKINKLIILLYIIALLISGCAKEIGVPDGQGIKTKIINLTLNDSALTLSGNMYQLDNLAVYNYGFYWSKYPDQLNAIFDYEGLKNNADNGWSIVGNQNTEVIFGKELIRTSLDSNTVYYINTFATNRLINSPNKFFPGDSIAKIFIPALSAPLARTDSASLTSNTEALLYGNVYQANNQTINERGFCYSTTDAYPTLSNAVISEAQGVGAYNLTLTNLQSGTNYFYRAYVKTITGLINYGEVKLLYNGGNVITPDFSLVNQSYSSTKKIGVNLSVNSIGTFPVIEAGICANTVNVASENVPDKQPVANFVPGQTQQIISGLIPNTQYYVYAYAKTLYGTYYSNILPIKTEATISSFNHGIGSGTALDYVNHIFVDSENIYLAFENKFYTYNKNTSQLIDNYSYQSSYTRDRVFPYGVAMPLFVDTFNNKCLALVKDIVTEDHGVISLKNIDNNIAFENFLLTQNDGLHGTPYPTSFTFNESSGTCIISSIVEQSLGDYLLNVGSYSPPSTSSQYAFIDIAPNKYNVPGVVVLDNDGDIYYFKIDQTIQNQDTISYLNLYRSTNPSPIVTDIYSFTGHPNDYSYADNYILDENMVDVNNNLYLYSMVFNEMGLLSVPRFTKIDLDGGNIIFQQNLQLGEYIHRYTYTATTTELWTISTDMTKLYKRNPDTYNIISTYNASVFNNSVLYSVKADKEGVIWIYGNNTIARIKPF